MLDQFLDELVKELSAEHLVEAKFLLASSVVRNPVVWPVVRPDLLAQVARTFLVFTDLLFLGKLFLTEDLVELLSECVKCGILVLWLLPVLLRDTDDTGGDVGRPTSTISLVDVLSASSLRSHEVDADVFHIHRKFSWHFRYNHHDCGAGVDTTLLLSFGNPLDLMDPRFMFQVLVNVLTFDLEDTFFATSVDTHILLELELADLEAHQAPIALVHLEEVLCEQTAFRATCRLKNLDSAVTLVSIAFRQDYFDNVVCQILDFLLHSSQLLLCDFFDLCFLVGLFHDGNVFTRLGEEGLEIVEELHFLSSFRHFHPKFLHLSLTLIICLFCECHEISLYGPVFLINLAKVVVQSLVICVGVTRY